MRFRSLSIIASLSLISFCQAQVSSVLPAALGSFNTGSPVSSIGLSGVVTVYAGSTTDSGPLTITVKADGSSAITSNLRQGTRTEAITSAPDDRTCSGTGPDGISHDLSQSNCWTAVPWLLPLMSLQTQLMPSNLGVADLGPTDFSGMQARTFECQLIVGPGKTSAQVTADIQQSSSATLYLDPATNQPLGLRFKLLSEGVSPSIVQVEVRYSSYKSLSGMLLPTHIERRFNGSLQMSIDLSQITAHQ